MKFSQNKSYIITTSKVLSKSERDALHSLCTRVLSYSEGYERRNGLMFLVGLECGLRASEITGLLVGDFDPESNSIYVRPLKGSNPREIPLRPIRSLQLKAFILAHFKTEQWHRLDRTAKIFDISYSRLFQLWQFYTPNKVKTLHSLRHTFAVELYSKTKDIMAVKLALGHRRIDNTMVYVDFWYSQNQMRKLMHG